MKGEKDVEFSMLLDLQGLFTFRREIIDDDVFEKSTLLFVKEWFKFFVSAVCVFPPRKITQWSQWSHLVKLGKPLFGSTPYLPLLGGYESFFHYKTGQENTTKALKTPQSASLRHLNLLDGATGRARPGKLRRCPLRDISTTEVDVFFFRKRVDMVMVRFFGNWNQ